MQVNRLLVKCTIGVGDSLPKETEPKRDSVAGLPGQLVAARRAAGFTQATAAVASGINNGNLSRYETGAKTPTLAVLYKLAAAYGCNVCDLLPGGILPRAASPEPVAPPPAPRPKARGKLK